MRILTTGVLSGFGRYIHETLGGIGWTRQFTVEDREEVQRKGTDIIIHCAFNSRQTVDSDHLYSYLMDNVFLTKELISIPHRKFMFISSVDVYPKMQGLRSEKEMIDLFSVKGLYGMTKLMSESIVREHCPNYLILRCSSLLGKYSGKNNLIRIMEDEPCGLTLSGDSRLNCVLYLDVSEVIRFAIKHDIEGIYNVTSSENIFLSEVASVLDKQVNFGSYYYDVGDIDNSKISSIFPIFRKTSKEVIVQFARLWLGGVKEWI